MKKYLLLFTFSILFGITKAQVTIGSDNEPAKGAILDIKTQNSDVNNVTSDKGGLLLPRVQLKGLYSLLPFIPDANLSTEGSKHIGLTVYNITPVTAQNLVKGFYIWDGLKWVLTTISADNGLTLTAKTIQLGGTLNKPTTINNGANNLTLNTRGTGKLQITDGNQASGKVLTSDANGLATWQQPGFSEFTQIPFATNIINIYPNAERFYYTGLSVTFPAEGTYSVTLSVRLRSSVDVKDMPIVQLLPVGANTDPYTLWHAATPRFAGSSEIMGIARKFADRKEYRFHFSQNITITPTTGRIAYLIMFIDPYEKNGTATIDWGNGGPKDTQAVGGSFVKIN